VACRRRLLFLPFLLLFAGCGVLGSSRPVAPAPPATPNATRTVAAPKPKTYVPDRVIASRSGEIDGDDVQLEITHLERSGQTVSLSFRLTAESIYSPNLGKTFDDGEIQPINSSGSEENGNSVDGVYLLDRAHAQKYLVARDPNGRCICDVGIGEIAVGQQHPVTLSATYGAPPPNVTAVDVVVPRFGTFANVPLG
jgi:hypothetical protein